VPGSHDGPSRRPAPPGTAAGAAPTPDVVVRGTAAADGHDGPCSFAGHDMRHAGAGAHDTVEVRR
jgi:hypothetical protein